MCIPCVSRRRSSALDISFFRRITQMTSMIAKLALRCQIAFALAAIGGPALAQDSFDLPAPGDTSQLQHLTLYATQYYVSSSDNSLLSPPQAFPILGTRRTNLGATIVSKDWCSAALEGTNLVRMPAGATILFNYLGLDPSLGFQQADCRPLYPHLDPSVSAAMTRTLYFKSPADAPYGLGDQAYYRLVPFRSIAIDRSKYPAKSATGTANYYAFYIPSLKGIKVPLDQNTSLVHDGYVFAADTGGAIKNNHIDVFVGTYDKDFAPSVIKSVPSGTFDAYLVTDSVPINYLKQLHLRPGVTN